jgi:putative spermidine/putrescine transport system permease protein
MLAAERRSMAAPWLLAGVPALFLFVVFVVPNALLVANSFLLSESQVLTNQLTFENYRILLTRPLYLRIILRTFTIGLSVGALVVVLSYPLAFFLARTTSRWKELLIALSLTPLLASVVVRTYGWWVILNRDGALNNLLRALHLVDQPLPLMPSTGAIIIGLTHSLLPYGVLTILTALNSVNPRLEQAAMSLGANRRRTFVAITLPLSLAGVAGTFLLSFTLAISAFATPAMLGGASIPVVATQIYGLLLTELDWSLGSALSVLLVAAAIALTVVGTIAGTRRARL